MDVAHKHSVETISGSGSSFQTDEVSSFSVNQRRHQRPAFVVFFTKSIKILHRTSHFFRQIVHFERF